MQLQDFPVPVHDAVAMAYAQVSTLHGFWSAFMNEVSFLPLAVGPIRRITMQSLDILNMQRNEWGNGVVERSYVAWHQFAGQELAIGLHHYKTCSTWGCIVGLLILTDASLARYSVPI